MLNRAVLDILFPYATFGLELGLLVFLIARGQLKRRANVVAYLAFVLLVDGLGRSFVRYHYGYRSDEYAVVYWVTDYLLGVATFLLVCSFFRRACRKEEKMWSHIRLVLVMAFFILAVISLVPFSGKFPGLLASIVPFERNLYFTSLVLNTLLYILLQQIDSEEDELAFFVCGLGIQYAGPAATWALLRLAPQRHLAEYLVDYLGPLCTLGMLGLWFYAVLQPVRLGPPPASPPKKMEPRRDLHEMSPAAVAAQ